MSHVSDIRLRALDGIQENCSWPADLALGFNIYAYTGGDPLNATDPSGMNWVNDAGTYESGYNNNMGGGACGCEGNETHDNIQSVYDGITKSTQSGNYAYSDFSPQHVAAALGFPADPRTFNQTAQLAVAADIVPFTVSLVTPSLIAGAVTLGIITDTYGDEITDQYDKVFRASYINSALSAAGVDPNSDTASRYDVHHIVARYASLAAPARGDLAGVGIGLNDPPNLVPLLRDVHQSLYKRNYYTSVNGTVRAASSLGRVGVTGALGGIAGALSAYGHYP